jgi:hypothetical protein
MADIDDRWHRRGKYGKPERTGRYGVGARWLVRWREADGRQRKKSFARKADAERFATTVGHELQSGSYIAPEAGRVLVGEWASRWLAAQGHLAASTADRYRIAIATHIAPRWATVNLSAVTHADVQHWISDLARVWSGASVIKVHRVFSQIMAWAVRDSRISGQPR